jgi:hypothetical protein
MFHMWKNRNLWPWQWGFADEPIYEHIMALEAMDAWYNDPFNVAKREKQQQQKTGEAKIKNA